MNCRHINRLKPTFLSFLRIVSTFFLFVTGSNAQTSPPCLQLFFPVTAAQAGDTVCVPLMARGFDQIATMQYAITWDATAFDLVRVDHSNTELPDFNVSNFNASLTPPRVVVAWDAPPLSVTLPDTVLILQVCLRVKTSTPGFYRLKLGPDPYIGWNWPSEIFKLDPVTWQFYEVPLVQQIGGIVVGSNNNTGDLAITSLCGAYTTCGNANGYASVTAAGGQAPYQYQWSGPGGFSASGPDVTGLPGGIYTVTVTDQSGATVASEIDIKTQEAGFATTVSSQPAYCGQPTGCAQIEVGGNNPPFTLNWSAGSGSGSQVCGLPPGLHSVTITDAAGCIRTQDFFVDNDTLLQALGDWNEIQNCNGTGTASVTIWDGAPPFQYLWSTGDTTATVADLPEGVYQVTVTTAGGCSVTTQSLIFDVSTANWQLELQKKCTNPGGISGGDLYLAFNPAGDIEFPATLHWSNGTTRLVSEAPSGNYLDTLPGLPAGHYAVTVTDAAGCSALISTVLNCIIPPPVPDSAIAFYIQDEFLSPQYATDSCLGVYVRHLREAIFQFGLTWDPGLVEIPFLANINPAIPGLTAASFNLGDGTLNLSWSDPAAAGVSIPGNTRLFDLCFTPEVPVDHLDVQFSMGRLVAAPAGDRPFIGKNGFVLFDEYSLPVPAICGFGVADPECSSDGYSRILLEGCDPDTPATGYYFHDGVYHDDLAGLLFADSGNYEIHTYLSGQEADDFYVYIPAAADTSACVWPGDADNNNAANHHDLLYIGLAYGQSGPLRTGASAGWAGQDAPDWPQATPARAVNFKNIDTNGDGTVDAADTLAIVQNWGRVVNPVRDDPFNAPLGNPTGNPHPPFTIRTDTLIPGQTIALPLLLGSPVMPADNIYGLAFSISYDPAKVKPGVFFQPADSWMGHPDQLLWLQRDFSEQGRLDVAITRTDGMPVSGSGLIGDVFVIIEDDIFLAPGPEELAGKPDLHSDSMSQTTLYFRNLNLLDASGASHLLDAPPVDLVIMDPGPAASVKPKWEDRVSIVPNPANESLQIESPHSPLRRIEVASIDGRVLQSWSFDGEQRQARISLDRLPPMPALLRIFAEKGVILKKLVIAR